MSETMTSSSVLDSLPDDVLRRIIDTVGREKCCTVSNSIMAWSVGDVVRVSPLKTAHVLASVSRRLRSYVIDTYLPSVTSLTHKDLLPLSRYESLPVACDALVALLSRTTNLKAFIAEGVKPGLVTSAAICAMTAAAAQTLEDVDIKYVDVSDDAVKPLFKCPNLKRLQISYGRAVTQDLFRFPEGVTIIAPLEYLDLTWLQCVDSTAIGHIARISTLKTLLMKNCERFDDNAAEVLITGPAAQSLEKVSVCYCPISDNTLHKLLESMPMLTQLLVAERTGIHAIEGAYTQIGIDAARDRFQNVGIILDT